jgi:hypothetical protein
VQQYVQVALVQRDAARARALACRAPEVQDIDGLRNEIVQREQQLGVRITVFTGAMTVSRQDGAGAAVRTDVSVSIRDEAGRTSIASSAFQFMVVQESGWRVCSAARLG